MCVMKRVVLLLLVAAMGSEATPEDCDGLNKTLQTADMGKIFGNWVLVWSVSDPPGDELVTNLTSSHIEFQLLPDNHTVSYSEWNLFENKECTKYFLNMSMPSDPADPTLHLLSGAMEKAGVLTSYNDSGEAYFFESCADCLTFVYKGVTERYLMTYKSKGHHQDVEQMKTAHADHNKLAECLGFSHDEPYIYGGATDFCGKTSEQTE